MGKGKRLREAKRLKQAEQQEQIRKASVDVANVVVRCPKTDRFFPTGVATDPRSFESGTFSDNSTQCPLCGEMHRWGDSEIALDN